MTGLSLLDVVLAAFALSGYAASAVVVIGLARIARMASLLLVLALCVAPFVVMWAAWRWARLQRMRAAGAT